MKRYSELPASLSAVTAGLAIALVMGLGIASGKQHVVLITSSAIFVSCILVVFAGQRTRSSGTSAALLPLMTWCVFFLVSIVFREPAPFDLLVLVLILTTLAHKSFSKSDWTIFTLLATLEILILLTQLISLYARLDGLRYFAITVFLMALSIGVYFLASGTPNLLPSLVNGYIAGAVATTMIAIAGFTGTLSLPFDVAYSGGERLQGFFKDPNVLGAFLVSALVFTISKGFSLYDPRSWIVTPTILLTLGAGILMAYSRGAWVNLAVAMIVYFGCLALVDHRALLRLVIAGPFLIFASYRLSLIALDTNQFLSQRLQSQAYDDTRFAVQELAFRAFERSPLFGYGPGSADTDLQQSTHSLYLRMLYENGLLGSIAITVLVGFTIVRLWKAFLTPHRGMRMRLPAALLAILSGILINSIVVDTLHWRHLWITIGIAWAISGSPNPTSIPLTESLSKEPTT